MSKPKKMPKEKGRLHRLLLQTTIVKMETLGYRRTTRLYICNHPTWGRIAIFKKPIDSVFRDGHSMNDALATGCMCWMMESSVAHFLKEIHGVTTVIFFTDILEDIYVSRMDDWHDDTKLYQRKNVSAGNFRRAHIQMKYLPFQHFRKSPGGQKLLIR